MHKPWLYHITGISGYQVVAQRIERHGRSREIRNAHVLARCGVFAVEELRLLLDKPPCVALPLLGIILKATAAYAACDEAPSRDRKRKTGMSDSTLILVIESKQSRDGELKCKGCREAGAVPRKGNERKSRKYITVVRDLDSGRVLNVSRGKGEAALKELAYRLRKQKAVDKIRCVCMDMSNAYYAWVEHNLRKDTLIVFDHFHVIMKMNEHINSIRRMAMAHVNADTRRRLADLAASDKDRETIKRIMLNAKANQEKAKKYLKGNMKLLLMNSEDVAEHPKAKARRDRMLAKYTDINAAHLLKEELRAIYANAKTKIEAAGLFKDWIAEARATDVDAMVSTIEEHLTGILGFWEFRGVSNASVEGFNNKIRWLIKQAYGYRDFKYFKLKVFDLPNLKSRDSDC